MADKTDDSDRDRGIGFMCLTKMGGMLVLKGLGREEGRMGDWGPRELLDGEAFGECQGLWWMEGDLTVSRWRG